MNTKRIVNAAIVCAVFMGIVGCTTPDYNYVPPSVSPKLAAFEQQTLFESKDVTSYFRKKVAVPPGDCELVFEVVAGKADGAPEKQPAGWWQKLEIYRKGKLISGCYKGPAVPKNPKSVTACLVKFPHGCDEVEIGLGQDEQSAGFYTVKSVKLTMQRATVHSLTPAMEIDVPDNTPLLQWKSLATYVMVDLSRDKAFPEDATQTQTVVGDRRLQVVEPLDPGPWYWRVRTIPGFVGAPQTFTVTAKKGQDTTPPSVPLAHRHIKGKNDPITLKVPEEGKWRVTAEISGLQCMVTDTPDGSIDVVPETGWRPGLNKVVFRFFDAIGNVGRQDVFVSYSARVIPTVKWTAENGVQIEGAEKRLLPLGVYGVKDLELGAVDKTGFTIVQDFDADNASIPMTRIWLDMVKAHGLKAVVGFNPNMLRQMRSADLAERVSELMSHPAVLGWYLPHELDLPETCLAPYKLTAAYKLIKALDPYHPVLLSCRNETLMEDYKDCYDVFLTQEDYAPIGPFLGKAKDSSEFLKEMKKVGALVLPNAVMTVDPVTTRQAAFLSLMNQSGFFVLPWVDSDNVVAMAEKNLNDIRPVFENAKGEAELKQAVANELKPIIAELKSVDFVFLRDGVLDRFVKGDVQCYVKKTRREVYVLLVCLGDNGTVDYRLPIRGKHRVLTKDEPVSMAIKDFSFKVELKKGQVFILEVR